MLILRAVIDQEEQLGRWETLDQAVQQRLGFRINPVQILKDQQERLYLALPQEHPLEGVERALAALRWVECQERAVFWQGVQE